jgi:paraquat-inducible protein A
MAGAVMADQQLIACHECDLLQREIALPPRRTALCARCGATLYRSNPNSVDRSLAFTVAGLILFVLANVFPLVGLRIGSDLIQTTLFGAAKALYVGGMKTVGVVVLISIVIAPLIELIALTCLLLPLRMNRHPRSGATIFRALAAVQPWRMVEVLMLGVLVALVKLAHIAEVVPGVALWSLGALVVTLAAIMTTFDPRELWTRIRAVP